MLKLLLFLFVFFFVVIRVGGFFVRLLFGGMQNPQQNNQGRQFHRNENSQTEQKKERLKKEGYTGGEYIDYEEVE